MRNLVVVIAMALSSVLAGCGSMSAANDAEPAAKMGRASYGMVMAESSDGPPALEREAPRMIIRTATVRFECDEPDSAVEESMLLAKDHGGWVQQSGKGYTTLRIPDEGLDEFLTAIEYLGEIVEKEIRGKDVTAQHRDTKIRLENLESAHKRYQQLLERADTVAEALAVEKELERVVTQIELLKGRIKSLESQVSYSTVTLRFRRVSSPGPLAWPFIAIYRGLKWLVIWE